MNTVTPQEAADSLQRTADAYHGLIPEIRERLAQFDTKAEELFDEHEETHSHFLFSTNQCLTDLNSDGLPLGFTHTAHCTRAEIVGHCRSNHPETTALEQEFITAIRGEKDNYLEKDFYIWEIELTKTSEVQPYSFYVRYPSSTAKTVGCIIKNVGEVPISNIRWANGTDPRVATVVLDQRGISPAGTGLTTLTEPAPPMALGQKQIFQMALPGVVSGFCKKWGIFREIPA